MIQASEPIWASHLTVLRVRNSFENARRLTIREDAIEEISASIPSSVKATDRITNPQAFFKNYYWFAAREHAIERDGGKCTLCGSEENLEAHHILYREFGGSDHPDNLITLCEACHDFAHSEDPQVNKMYTPPVKDKKKRMMQLEGVSE